MIARIAGSAAYAVGYARAVVPLLGRGLERALRLDWRTVRFGPIVVRTPPCWGSFEPGLEGDLILHNLPRKFRVDGDTVWYGAAIELRVGRFRRDPRSSHVSTMRSVHRNFGSVSSPLVAELRVANGVRPAQEKIAVAVLRGLRLAGDPGLIDWPDRGASRQSFDGPLRPTLVHDSPVSRDFESFDNLQRSLTHD